MKTAAQFDLETAERLDRIRQFPNPRSFSGRVRRFAAWCRAVHQEAALDSLRNVLAVIGGAALLAYLGTMPNVLVPLGFGIFALVWWLDYERHF
jgi:hypothetical protein